MHSPEHDVIRKAVPSLEPTHYAIFCIESQLLVTLPMMVLVLAPSFHEQLDLGKTSKIGEQENLAELRLFFES